MQDLADGIRDVRDIKVEDQDILEAAELLSEILK